MSKFNYQTTTEILKKYVDIILEKNQLDAKFVSYKLEHVFGKEIHKKIYGFVNFMITEKENIEDIRITLIHDIAGALNNDKLMLPRVDDYAKYAEL
tara:strand:+ start:66 stop:353 length:288 start_codon:yes stop_codon:yes gene_type:complete